MKINYIKQGIITKYDKGFYKIIPNKYATKQGITDMINYKIISL